MRVGWRDSPEVLTRLLRERGQDPMRVTDVEAAWQAFRSFLACRVDGLEPDPGSDADGFVVQWGRYSWNDKRPSLAFTRLFAVDVRATWTESDWYQPEQWVVNLELVFEDVLALAGIGRLGVANTGFDFSPLFGCPCQTRRDGGLRPAISLWWSGRTPLVTYRPA